MKIYLATSASYILPQTKWICFGLKAFKEITETGITKIEITDFSITKYPEEQYIYIFEDTNNPNYFKKCNKLLFQKNKNIDELMSLLK